MRIAARPTTYKGIRMRSRLEAAYAQFLDRGGVAWTYEPRVFADRRGQYLPDFQVMDGADPRPWFIEVKPTDEAAAAACDRMEIILSSEPDASLMIVVPTGDYIAGELEFDSLVLGCEGWRWVGRPEAGDATRVDVPPTGTTESLKHILPRVYDLLARWYATAGRSS